LLPVDAAIADYIRNGVESAGLTYREIAAQTGMSINRIGIILRKEPPPATVGEISCIARTFGMKASDLIAEAETSLLVRDARSDH
jgi:transcriptional regulator with XRE-family HTH domain